MRGGGEGERAVEEVLRVQRRRDRERRQRAAERRAAEGELHVPGRHAVRAVRADVDLQKRPAAAAAAAAALSR